MASIYREGKGWAARVRTSLHRRYKSGFRTHAEAREWARETESAVAKTKQPKGLGPQQTTLAMALRMYAEDFSVKKKGCVQEVVRINRFLALAQLPRLKAVRKSPRSPAALPSGRGCGSGSRRGGRSPALQASCSSPFC